MMMEDSGRLSGSREPSQSALSRPVGFDPERGDDWNTLDAWALNVMLESAGREDATVAIGGAVLDLHDLKRILYWAQDQAASGMETPQGEG